MTTRELTLEELAIVMAEENIDSLRYLLSIGYGNPPEKLKQDLVDAIARVERMKAICSRRSSTSQTCACRQDPACQEVLATKLLHQ